MMKSAPKYSSKTLQFENYLVGVVCWNEQPGKNTVDLSGLQHYSQTRPSEEGVLECVFLLLQNPHQSEHEPQYS